MRSRFSIIIFIGVMLALLVALNAASYVRVEREAELEAQPDRSTLNAGASGTRALYEYLEESEQRVVRWRESPLTLAKTTGAARPATFVIIGAVRLDFKDEEIKSILEFAEAGGHVVIIDRSPPASLMTGDDWHIGVNGVQLPDEKVRADDVQTLTADTPALAPAQPTLFTRDVERVAPSRYASRLHVARNAPPPDGTNSKITNSNSDDVDNADDAPPPPVIIHDSSSNDESPVIIRPERAPENVNDASEANANDDDAVTTTNDEGDATIEEPDDEDKPPPPLKPQPARSPQSRTIPYGDPRKSSSPQPPTDEYIVAEDEKIAGGQADEDAPVWSAPVLHVGDAKGALLADLARGKGRIIVLSDPFIVANSGLSRADNLQLVSNILTQGNGLIAFDEYQQGRGTTHNQLAAYFAGTPVLAMCAQLFLIALAVVWTRGRRFARPLPAPRIDRRSKLEFVASMAELQQRARAFDLAIENVYGRTRRALARYGGTDSAAPRETIAQAVAARSGRGKEEIESVMRDCEDAMSGTPVSARRSLALVARLRELERALGIRMRAREIKQTGRS